MEKQSYRDADMECPYFLRIESQTCHLTCEGVLPGTSVKSHYLNKEALYAHTAKFCAGDYQSCPWFIKLTK